MKYRGLILFENILFAGKKKLFAKEEPFGPKTVISSLNLKFCVVVSFSFLMELTTIY